MRCLYKATGVLTNIMIALIILCAVLFIGGLFVPKFFGTTPYIVLSSSMEPTIHTGSLVYISKTDKPIGTGDIVGYMAGDMPVVHRVIGRGNTGLITQGDANDIPDMNEVTDEELLGKCTLVIPGAGYAFSAIRSHTIAIGGVELPTVIPGAALILFLLCGAQYCIGLLASADDKGIDH